MHRTSAGSVIAGVACVAISRLRHPPTRLGLRRRRRRKPPAAEGRRRRGQHDATTAAGAAGRARDHRRRAPVQRHRAAAVAGGGRRGRRRGRRRQRRPEPGVRRRRHRERDRHRQHHRASTASSATRSRRRPAGLQAFVQYTNDNGGVHGRHAPARDLQRLRGPHQEPRSARRTSSRTRRSSRSSPTTPGPRVARRPYIDSQGVPMFMDLPIGNAAYALPALLVHLRQQLPPRRQSVCYDDNIYNTTGQLPLVQGQPRYEEGGGLLLRPHRHLGGRRPLRAWTGSGSRATTSPGTT